MTLSETSKTGRNGSFPPGIKLDGSNLNQVVVGQKASDPSSCQKLSRNHPLMAAVYRVKTKHSCLKPKHNPVVYLGYGKPGHMLWVPLGGGTSHHCECVHASVTLWLWEPGSGCENQDEYRMVSWWDVTKSLPWALQSLHTPLASKSVVCLQIAKPNGDAFQKWVRASDWTHLWFVGKIT